ncbi:MAG: leucine-rich repeat domain-containing protein, partial [Candidatus Omnitrophica bacterium]|nr:leucine-rich repeat domain-containing protein [Candidatus Omnitrophota bacterium]
MGIFNRSRRMQEIDDPGEEDEPSSMTPTMNSATPWWLTGRTGAVDFDTAIAEYPAGTAGYTVATLLRDRFKERLSQSDILVKAVRIGAPKGKRDGEQETVWVARFTPTSTPDIYMAVYYISPTFIRNLARLYETDPTFAQEVIDTAVRYHEPTHIFPIPASGKMESLAKKKRGNEDVDIERINGFLRLCGIDRIDGVDMNGLEVAGRYRGRRFEKIEVLAWIAGWSKSDDLAQNIARYMFYRFAVVDGITDRERLLDSIRQFVEDPPRHDAICNNFFWLNSRFYNETYNNMLTYAEMLLDDYNNGTSNRYVFTGRDVVSAREPGQEEIAAVAMTPGESSDTQGREDSAAGMTPDASSEGQLQKCLSEIPPASESFFNTVIFDAGNVIYRFDYGRAAEELVERFGVNRERALSFFEDRNSDQNNPIYRYEHGIIVKDELVQGVKEWIERETGGSIELNVSQFENIFNSIWLGDIPETIALIRGLKAKGYKIRVMSSMNSIHHDFIMRPENSAIGGLLDSPERDFYASYQTGLAKPDKESYVEVADDSGDFRERCLFIDDLKTNTDGAMRAGLTSSWFNPDDVLGSIESISDKLSTTQERQPSVDNEEILRKANAAGLILKARELINREITNETKQKEAFSVLIRYARYILGIEPVPAGVDPLQATCDRLGDLGVTDAQTIFDRTKKEAEDTFSPENITDLKKTEEAKIEGKLSSPKYDFIQKKPIDQHPPIKTRHSNSDVSKVLARAVKRGFRLIISGAMRLLDGAGSSLDLPFFQWLLTKLGAHKLADFPITPTVASAFGAKIRIEKASRSNQIEYIAPDFRYPGSYHKKAYRGKFITEDRPYIRRGKVELDENDRTPYGQLDAAPFIFQLFGLTGGYRIIVEDVAKAALAGGMESSNVANIALVTAASILSGADLSEADIFSLAVKLENDEFGGLTGGQGHRNCQQGGVFANLWPSGAKGVVDGELFNPYSAFSIPLIKSEEGIKALEDHILLVLPGKEYKNGMEQVKRTANLINEMWTDLLKYFDEVGFLLHYEKLSLASRYIQAMRRLDEAAQKKDKQAIREAIAEITACLNRYVEIRNTLQYRWMALMFDAHNAREKEKDGQQGWRLPDGRLLASDKETPLPTYAEELARKVFDETHPEYEDFRAIREEYEKKGEEYLRSQSLYSYERSGQLAEKIRGIGGAHMDLGAGGPGANCIEVHPDGKARLKGKLEEEGYHELTNDTIAAVMQDETGEIIPLAGYMDADVSLEPLAIEGVEELNNYVEPGENVEFRLPQEPATVTFGDLIEHQFDVRAALQAQEEGTEDEPAGMTPDEGLSFEEQIEAAKQFLRDNGLGENLLIVDEKGQTLRLYLSGAPVINLKPLSNLTNLQSLHLSNTQVTDFEPLRGLTNLRELGLSNTQITNLEPLRGLTNLQWLNLSNTQVTDLELLRGLRNLERLNLSGT